MYEAGESGVNKWTKAVSESGYAAEQAAAKNNNLKGDLENLSGSMESLMISVGEGAQGPLRKMVQGLDTMVDTFSGLPSGAQQTIVVMASLAGVFGAVHKAAGNLNGSTSTMANNIGLAIDPIQRVKTALGSAQTAFELFKGSSMSASEQMEAFGTSASKAQLKTAGFKAVGSSVMSLLGGPWGIALTVAGAALSAFISHQQKAKEAAEQLQSALESGSNISETIAGAYQDMSSGGVKLTTWLDKAGISLTDMTSAAMGNEAALKRVNKQIKEINNKPGIGATTASAIKKALKEESKAYDDASKKANEKSKAAKNAVDADGKSASAAKEAASANKELGSSASDASSQIDDLVQALFGLESGNLTADQAVDQLNQKIGELSKTCEDNGVVFDQSGNLLDRFSEEGTKTKQALEDIASSAQNAAEKILKQGESTGFSSGEIERANGVLQDARDAIIRQAEASGMSEQAANALADRWGLSSDSIKASIDNIKKTADNNKAKLDVDDSKAKSKTDNAKKNVDSVNKAKGTAKLDADDKASGKAKNAEKNVESANKSKGKATLDATDKASGEADKAKGNVRSVNNAKGTAKLDATDKASGKINAVNGMKLNNKNMILTASDHASSKINAVNNKRLNNKKTTLNASDKASSKVDSVNRKTIGDKHFTVRVTDHASATLRSIQNYQIADKSFTVTEKTKKEGGYTGGMFTDGHFQKFAGGGMVSGYVDPAWAPGNGLSDSVYLLNARLAAGEYTHNAAATAYYGVDNMRLLNERKIPREVFSTANQMTGNQVSVQVDTASVVAAITSLHNDLGAIISAASGDLTVSDRDLGRLIRKYARA